MKSSISVSVLACLSIRCLASAQGMPGAASYQAPGGFPTSVFSSYWEQPVATQEPQPALYDSVLRKTYQFNLTNPYAIPTNKSDPLFYPKALGHLSAPEAQTVLSNAIQQINEIITGSYIQGNCSKCIAALAVAKTAVQFVPTLAPGAMVSLCKAYKLHSNAVCEQDFAANTFGAYWTQTLSLADVTGLDGQYICQSIGGFCPAPTVSQYNITNLFPKPKPANATAPKASGKRLKVVHISDLHIDPRYAVGSEANCTTSLCCRANNNNTAIPVGQVSLASPLFGSFKCDTPYDLALAALEAIGPLTGTDAKNPLAWAIYTGDVAAHDPEASISREFIEYSEDSVYTMLKKFITSPIFPALGNHDTSPTALDAPHSFPGPSGEEFSWNYEHVLGLWRNNGWISAQDAQAARVHYGAYSVRNPYGLRIITLNADFWYRNNFLNFVNTSNPDVSGQLRFVIDELQAAEDAGERVWILGHVLPGWDGSNSLPNPTDLFYRIVERYSPHVIAAMFFGHTHEDEFMLFYANNGTAQTRDAALNVGWIGPSITPLTNLNSGFRLYDVDAATFDVLDAYTFFANVSDFAALDGNKTGPTFRFEYSARDVYGPAAAWPADAPLNATFWHAVTDAMLANRTLVSVFNTFEGKMSVHSPNCTSDACTAAKVCYMRSGSHALGSQCPQGFGSVQSPFTGKNF